MLLGALTLVLSLLNGVLPILTKSGAPAEIIAGIQRAIDEITKVHGTVVTKVQVDNLLDVPKW